MYTNHTNIPLVLAVWLAANDGYDLKAAPDTISATSLMKPTKSLVLSMRLAMQDQEGVIDISDLIPSRMGTAVHTAAETSWLYSRERGMTQLGIPLPVIEKVRINPDTPGEDPRFDIYMELRSNKKVGKWTISGKFDFVHEGRVKDIKTTKTYNWIARSNDEKYAIQGSIYRYLNPDIITDDFVDILMIFTDWSPYKALADKAYPQSAIKVRTLPLMTIPETERWIKNRLSEIEGAWDLKQVDMPLCTPEELWMDPPKYAYYKKPGAARATKVFDTAHEANARKAADGIPGSKVVFRQTNPKFCNYCDARSICLQAEQYVQQGILKL
jgi:hypothetical protein